MSILYVLLVIVVVGVMLWAINAFIPMDQKIKTILNIVIVIFLIIWLLKVLGVMSFLAGAKI